MGRSTQMCARVESLVRSIPAVPTAMVVAAALSLPGLGSQPLSWDELVSVAAARRSLSHLAALLAHTDAPLGLYYLGMHGWIRLLAAVGIVATEGWLRFPSALAAIAAVGLIACLGERLVGRAVGLFSGILLSLWPLFQFYARDARPYSLAVLAVLASTVALLNARSDPRWWRLTLYSLALSVAVYLQLFAALALVPQLVVAFRSTGCRRRLLLAQGAAVAGVVPLLWIAGSQSGEIGWVPPVTGMRIAGFLITVSGAAGLACVLAALVIVVRRGKTVAPADPLLLRGQALTPPLLLIAGSLIVPVVVPRYALVAVPALVLLVARAVWRLPRRARLVFGCLLLGAGLVTVLIQRQAPYKYEDFRAMTDQIEDHARPGDTVHFDPSSYRVGFAYYAGRDPVTTYPADTSATGIYAGDSIGGIRRISPDGSRVWLLTDGRKGAIPAGFRPVWSRQYGVVRLDLLDRRPISAKP